MSNLRLGLVCFALLALAVRAPAAPEYTARDYQSRVEQVARALEAASRAGKEGSRQAEQALRELPEQAKVSREAGPPVAVDNRELLSRLRGLVRTGRKGVRRAAVTVGGLQQSVSRQASPTPAGARRTMAKVLKRSEFRLSWWTTQQQRFYDWLDRLVRKLLNRIHVGRVHRGLNWHGWRTAGVAALVVGGAAMLYLIIRLLTRRAPRPVAEEEFVLSARPKIILPHAAWLEEADRRQQAREYLEAVRALHMAALMKLDAEGLVRYDTAYTDNRFVRLLQARGHPELARVLGRLNQLFARLWYGRRTAGRPEYQEAEELWRDLEGRTKP